MEEAQRKAIQWRVARMERELAQLIDGWRTPGSGSKAIKGDGESRLFKAEAKYSSQVADGVAVIPFQLAWLETLVTQAKAGEKIPLLALEWVDGRRLVLLPLGDYEVLSGEPLRYLPQQSWFTRELPLRCPAESPLAFYFAALRTNRPIWAALAWPEFAALRREAQPKDRSGSPKGKLGRGGLRGGKGGRGVRQ